MIRNTFNVVRSVGLIFFGVGILLVGMTLPEVMERIENTYTYNRSIWEDYLAAYTVLGGSFAIAGIAGVLKLKWFPRAGIIILVFALILFLLLLFNKLLPSSRNDDFFLLVAISITVCTLITSFGFLLNNHYFIEALNEEDDSGEKDDRILDAERF